jgi:hypothetical protein
MTPKRSVVAAALDSDAAGPAQASKRQRGEMTVISPATRNDWILDAEIHWKTFVWKTTTFALSEEQSAWMQVFLDEARDGKRSRTPLVIEIADDVFQSVQEMEMVCHSLWLTETVRPLPKAPKYTIDQLARLAQLVAYFGYEQDMYTHMDKLRNRAPRKLPVQDVLALAARFNDRVIWRRGIRLFHSKVTKRTVTAGLTDNACRRILDHLLASGSVVAGEQYASSDNEEEEYKNEEAVAPAAPQ